ncbi:MAG: threonine-phosphate decarboxylase CobD [Candidatus Omnitrophica bacterium]|nr:threonine-phosphate decarboxylase CobD [Candidatus Omnitrophota bacterium]MCG2702938.1 threonine-phosphate decarboxylase CobD [Candidatus Omnitrophota bacterium]
MDILREENHGGNVYGLRGNFRRDAVDFSANINPLGLPLRVKKLLRENIDMVSHYPQPAAQALRNDLAAWHGLKPDNLLIGNGSIEFIYLLPQVLNMKKALIITPGFSEYERSCRLYGVKPVFFRTKEKDGFKVDMPELIKAVADVDAVFLCNPNNPTGTIVPARGLSALIKYCEKHKVFLIVDEAFIDFSDDAAEISVIKETARHKYLLVLRSLTKIFALAGLRLGYVVACGRVIKWIESFQYPWNVNALAQAAAAEAIRDRQYIKKSRELIRVERDYLVKGLRNLAGIKVYPAEANFLLCKLDSPGAGSARELRGRLERRKVLIRDCRNFRGLGKRFFRLAVRNRAENKKLLSALARCLG